MPGFVYLALGDPLQKRNYYRAGWIKFKEDADMPAVLAELAEKKVRNLFRCPAQESVPKLFHQIEGFKLHLSHNLKPFTNRIRFAPEVASRPDRLTKDLANAKFLASLLEDEYDRIRRPPPRDDPPPQDGALGPSAQSGPAEDALMIDSSLDQDPEEDAPKSRGSEAVERRIEKAISDLKESGAVDVMNEREFEARKVRFHPLSIVVPPPPSSPTPLAPSSHHTCRFSPVRPLGKDATELTLAFFALLLGQDAIALDLYISYLRAAFNTCFYCTVVTDHVEELQRKCVRHVRKPMSKAMIEEVRAATLVTDEREVRETTNGDQRGGDEELAGEKPRVLEEKESGVGRAKDRDVTRAGQSVAPSLVA